MRGGIGCRSSPIDPCVRTRPAIELREALIEAHASKKDGDLLQISVHSDDTLRKERESSRETHPAAPGPPTPHAHTHCKEYKTTYTRARYDAIRLATSSTSSLADENDTWARMWNVDLASRKHQLQLYRMRVPVSYQLETEAAGVALGVAAAAAVSVTVLPGRPAIRW